MEARSEPSPALVEANRRLYHKRAVCQVVKSGISTHTKPAQAVVTKVATKVAAAEMLAVLPAHLGWESSAVTAVVRKTGANQHLPATEVTATAAKRPQPLVLEPAASTPELSRAGSVKLYADIGLGMLRQEMAASGRIWLLLRYMDTRGQGWLSVDAARQQLTHRESPLRVCGWRQLRNLLRQGENVFWQRTGKRIWIRSAAKVAYHLNVSRLQGQPVSIPVAELIQGISAVRAHFYMSFHSSRSKTTRSRIAASPISRASLTEISGVGKSSQRAYEKKLAVKIRPNFAVGPVAQCERSQSRAWKQGKALFFLKDFRGWQGKKGRTYLAWQLPNTYLGYHKQRPKGRQKRINRKLADLFMKGMTGNGEEMVEKRYYAKGVQGISGQLNKEAYWPGQTAASHTLWYVIESPGN